MALPAGASIRSNFLADADGRVYMIQDQAEGAPQPVTLAVPAQAATATLTNVSGSATSVTLLASNAAREGAMFFNDSAAALYLKYGATASTSSFTVKIPAGGYHEIPGPSIYTGIIDGIWDSATGTVRVTELSA